MDRLLVLTVVCQPASFGWPAQSLIRRRSNQHCIACDWCREAYYQWLAKHSRKAGSELRFVGKGHQMLWRTLVYVLFCIPVVTIPWSVRWFARWIVQQIEIDRRMAATA